MDRTSAISHWWTTPPSSEFKKTWDEREFHAGASFLILLLSQHRNEWMYRCVQEIDDFIIAKPESSETVFLQYLVTISQVIRGMSSNKLSITSIATSLQLPTTFNIDSAALRLEALLSSILSPSLIRASGTSDVEYWVSSGPLASVIYDTARSVSPQINDVMVPPHIGRTIPMAVVSKNRGVSLACHDGLYGIRVYVRVSSVADVSVASRCSDLREILDGKDALKTKQYLPLVRAVEALFPSIALLSFSPLKNQAVAWSPDTVKKHVYDLQMASTKKYVALWNDMITYCSKRRDATVDYFYVRLLEAACLTSDNAMYKTLLELRQADEEMYGDDESKTARSSMFLNEEFSIIFDQIMRSSSVRAWGPHNTTFRLYPTIFPGSRVYGVLRECDMLGDAPRFCIKGENEGVFQGNHTFGEITSSCIVWGGHDVDY